MDRLEVACAADGAYVRHTAAMLHSVLSNRGGLSVRVHFLHGPELAEPDRRKLAEMVQRMGGEIDFHLVPDRRVTGLPTFSEITATMWYRIYLPELVPDADRVLYLDGDTLALDSLEPLWATDLGENLVGAVSNVFMQAPMYWERPAALGLPSLKAYFNSGVLLLNLAEMRRDDTTTKLREFALTEDLMYPDQDAMNAVMGLRRLWLHPRWNVMNNIILFPWADEIFERTDIEEARERPGIRHFEGGGPNKPWFRACYSPMAERYFEHRRGTPWPRVTMTGPRDVRAPLRRLRRALRA